MYIKSAKELDVYKLAYKQAMDIFFLSKKFPKEEKYSLTDQIRKASRSVCANLKEAWSKRRYIAHFTSKLTDCDGENGETETWVDFAKDCRYIGVTDYNRLIEMNQRIGQMLGNMINKADVFCNK
ncbi:MAG: four helix bundle protein [Candidatus Marinimicrobia bacterium]|nr:four helix bundle protein [Candidatus Neomarinimicrobiota bacterium]